MNRTVRNVALLASGTILLSFGVLVVNQTAQVVQLASTAHPMLGRVTLWGLVTAYVGLAGIPLVLVLRLPRPLVPPESEGSPEFETHLRRLGQRLASNPYVVGQGLDLDTREGVEAGLAILSTRANGIVRETAAGVFIATAVSQSGRLDGLLVLAAQSRMVWRLAHLYYQRPNPRDLAHLYANVAATAFVAGELQELDLGEQVEPILSSAVSALGASVPGFKTAGTVLTNCVLGGSANAFLTLRVGMIAKRECGALVLASKPSIRRAATAEAAQLIGPIVADGTGRLSKALATAVVGKVRDAGSRLIARMRNGRAHEGPEAI
jgi:hypothetical protein